ncbi:hypothetical protein AMATHDRAFT_139382 [Amanita thiersii Skay4041]|uniref:Uncharacterized protein n=1 Tax=Amanita thiersii Skay4041 TaxID=703135 RepID=A0A2A9NY64_9AGAR|nr:hypothetical protein AMATHDRAFT_139382 [Amanita thiersii Skay4041]
MLSTPFHHALLLQKCHVLQQLRLLNTGSNIEGHLKPSVNQFAYQQLCHLIDGTVHRSEGNSCLLLGPRGSGKSLLMDKCLSVIPEQAIILRLSGWMQTSDRMALREIAHQLNEQVGSELHDLEGILRTSDDANSSDLGIPLSTSSLPLPTSAQLPSLISLLPTLPRSTIIILDAFDLFALHPRQSLLYCLLDTVQSCRAGTSNKGIAVIGITTRMDTINLLEKRVKSRFSGRMLRTAPSSEFQSWMRITESILCSNAFDTSSRQQMNEENSETWKDMWISNVRQFLADQAVLKCLHDTFSITRDVQVLTRLLTHLVTQLSPASPFPSSTGLTTAAAIQRGRSTFTSLYALPYPCLCLLVAAVLSDTSGYPFLTFEMLFESFRNQVRASTSAPVQIQGGSIGMMRCSRPAFELLISAYIFVPTTVPSLTTAKEFVKYRCSLERDDIKKAVDKFGQTNVKKWLYKSQQ